METLKVITRLLKNSTLHPKTGCWEWNKYRNPEGYGIIKVDKKVLLAHRVSYSLLVNDIPNNLCVCHTCDNPSCINPEHLWLGTNAENIKDKVHKNRQSFVGQFKGEKHTQSKLTDAQILFIRHSTLTQNKLAKMFNTTQSNISLIKNRKHWSHI